MTVSEGAQPGSSYERVPPQNVDAEMSVLGGMMLSKDAIADVIEILRSADFYRPAHASVYEVVIELFGRGEPADAVTVGAELKKKGELERIGGLPYLHTLVATVPTAANAAYYARIVREQAQLRSLVEAGTRIVQLGYTTDGADVEGLINLAQSEVFAISEQRQTTDYTTLEEIVPDLYEELERNANRDGGLDGVPTGFSELDSKLNGLRAGQMIIIAARPGGGKSTLAMDICRSAAVHNNMASAYFSLEMNRTELSMRLLAAESRVFLDRMIKGELETRDWQAIARTLDKISQAPLIVDDSPNMTMGEIRAKSRRMKQQHGIQLIVIDYLQLLTSGGKAVESRQQEVSEFSRSIKLLAKELEIPIVAVAQLNRDSERRNDRRPQVADLRESGSLEQDADVVLLIHRDDMFNKDSDRRGLAEIIIGKQRSGPTGTLELEFQGQYARFAESFDQGM
ncbi:MAG: replicative DNA helicase [Peptidiphaga sp.]|jgi:replicative DNA helicase|uniref:replicative DNA helicase n=1 Tax=Actinobaculum sp. oral taxon 183 TaxID=712888 RepID=UPI000396E6FD|nr:replicative DNA helicase [Actinobaculum sp. oral taxon 183]ERH20246.1 replicative DNA helicase [Actinobaculum sp. oral taxon 183 str. F0552]